MKLPIDEVLSGSYVVVLRPGIFARSAALPRNKLPKPPNPLEAGRGVGVTEGDNLSRKLVSSASLLDVLENGRMHRKGSLIEDVASATKLKGVGARRRRGIVLLIAPD